MMIKALNSRSVSAEVAALRPAESAGREIAEAVAALLADVRTRGDAALVEATARLDWEGASASSLAVAPEELEAAYMGVDLGLISALEMARTTARSSTSTNWCLTGGRRRPGPAAGRPAPACGTRRSVRAGRPWFLRFHSDHECRPCARRRSHGTHHLHAPRPGRERERIRAGRGAAHGDPSGVRLGGAQAIGAMAYGTETVPGST